MINFVVFVSFVVKTLSCALTVTLKSDKRQIFKETVKDGLS